MFETGRNYLIDKNLIKGKVTHRCSGKKGKTLPCLVFNLSGRCVAKKKVNGKKFVLSHKLDWKGHGDLGRNICQKGKKNSKSKKTGGKRKRPSSTPSGKWSERPRVIPRHERLGEKIRK